MADLLSLLNQFQRVRKKNLFTVSDILTAKVQRILLEVATLESEILQSYHISRFEEYLKERTNREQRIIQLLMNKRDNLNQLRLLKKVIALERDIAI